MDTTEPTYTVNDILDRYQRDCLDELAPRTRKDYLRHIPVLRKWFGERIANGLKPKDFAEFLNLKRGYQQRKRQLAVLSSAFTNAVTVWFIMDRNVLRDVKRKAGTPRTRLVTDEEFASLHAIAPLRVQLMMDLAVITGQRQGDLLSLRWDQIKNGVLSIHQSKTGKRLGIKLGIKLKKVLGKCMKLENDAKEYVIVSRTGTRYVSEGFRAVWQRTMDEWLKVPGRERFTFHDLRALCATKCATPEIAMRLLGHSNISMTLRVYRRGVEHVDSLE